MVHSPYAAVLSQVAQFDQNRRLSRHARNVAAALARCDLPLNSGIHGLAIASSGPAQGPIETLADLGLVNEWVGAANFAFHEDADLALIAACAEAWRRTVAGLWSYGDVPPNWRGAVDAAGLDLMTFARLRELIEAPDPVAASRALLLGWSGLGDEPSEQFRKRLSVLATPASQNAVAGEGPAEKAGAAARLMLQAHVPAAFVPALATLIACGKEL